MSETTEAKFIANFEALIAKVTALGAQYKCALKAMCACPSVLRAGQTGRQDVCAPILAAFVNRTAAAVN